MTGYIVCAVIFLVLGYYMGNRQFRYKVHDMIENYRNRERGDDYYSDEDED
ncbi:hypothetical protein LCGC14_0861920 [marine sediment metagenome]|uniref:Uncharacterized protein n=1 Tax=marine sediment metagenome TaxID=412755 RepID=A0A0F9RRV2_9ZZZZ